MNIDNQVLTVDFIPVKRDFLIGIADYIGANLCMNQSSPDEPPEYASQFDYDLAQMESEIRSYIADAPQPAQAALSASQIDTLNKLIDCCEILDKRQRPMCRDCADEDGTCPNGGLQCDMRKLFADARAILAASHQPAAVPVQAAFPARDLTKPAEQQGIFEKFTVRRNDGSDTVGGKHHGCRYFVLDLDHDQHAPAAMQSYAASCRATHPLLADDIEAQFGAAPVQAAAVPDGWKQLMQFYDAANAEELVKAQEDHIAALQAKLLKLTPIQPVFTKVREG